MINWVRKMLGLCVHEWGIWWPIICSDGTVVAHQRWCNKCFKNDQSWYPDGH